MAARFRPRTIRVRTLIAIVAVVGLAMGWGIQRVRSRNAAIAAIQKVGGFVGYAENYDVTISRSPGPRWLRKLVGVEVLKDVRRVVLNGPRDDSHRIFGRSPPGPREWAAALDAIGRLAELRELVVDGAGPEVYARLRDLPGDVELSLTGGAFTDDCLAGVSGLKQVRTLDLSRTRITDAGLAHLAAMPRLENLVLTDTKVTEEGMDRIAALGNLRSLGLGSFRTTAAVLARLRPLGRLESLNFPNFFEPDGTLYGVTDADLAPLADLPRLRALSLMRSKVRGAGLAALRNLDHLYLRDTTTIDDAGLAGVSGLVRLRTLDLSGTSITAAGLVNLAGLISVEDLSLRSLPVGGGLAPLAGLHRLRELDLFGTGVTDADLAHLAGARGLRKLSISSPAVTDAGLAHLAGMRELRELELDGVAITDAGLAHLAGLDRLERLDLSGNKVTDAGLVHLAGLTRLKWLGLPSFTGISDAGLVHLRGLRSLNFLCLRSSAVTTGGFADLQAYLPDTKIEH